MFKKCSQIFYNNTFFAMLRCRSKHSQHALYHRPDVISTYLLNNTLRGWAVDKASVPIRAWHFRPDVNVYVISNFLPLSFVLDNFFWYQIVCNQILYRNMYLNLEYFNIMANNTRERHIYAKNHFLIKFIVIITIFLFVRHCK